MICMRILWPFKEEIPKCLKQSNDFILPGIHDNDSTIKYNQSVHQSNWPNVLNHSGHIPNNGNGSTNNTPLLVTYLCVFFSENSSFVKHRYLGHSSLPPLPVHLPDAPAILHFKFLQNSLGRAQELFIHYSERGLLQGHLFLIVGVRALRRNH